MFNKNIRTSFTTLISVSVLVLFSKTAFAAPIHQPDLFEPNNLWKMEVFFDKKPTHLFIPAEINICFSKPITNEMHQEYAWLSPNTGGNGYASQEGDQVFMHGSLYQLDFGSEWEITSQNEASGHLRIWVPNKYYPYWDLNITLMRTKEKCETPEPPKPSP